MPDETKPKAVKCIVCGEESHRADWQGKAAPACDSHSAAEIAAKQPKPAAPTPKSLPTLTKPAQSAAAAPTPAPAPKKLELPAEAVAEVSGAGEATALQDTK